MSDVLTPSEQAYFDTRGEADPTPPPPTPEPVIDRAALEQERAATARLEQHIGALQQQVQALAARTRPTPEPERVPEFGQDPEAWIKAQIGATQKEIGELRQFRDQMAAQQQMAALDAHIRASVAEFSKTNSDYADAASHLIRTRAQELLAYGLSDQQIQQAVAHEALQLAASAAQAGRNPAEVVYRMAAARGYTPPASSPSSGQRASSKSMTAEALAALPASEFARWSDAHPDEFRRLMGG